MRPRRRSRANVRLSVRSLGALAALRSSVKERGALSAKLARMRRSKAVGDLFS